MRKIWAILLFDAGIDISGFTAEKAAQTYFGWLWYSREKNKK